jgi:hypothetical protein
LRQISVFIAGAQKAATSSLLHYLGQHPHVCIHDAPEFPYFVSDAFYATGWKHAFESSFSSCLQGDLLVAKNVGVAVSTVAMQRLREHNPECRVVLVVRNPIDRAYSAYWYLRARGWESSSTFEEALRREREGDYETEMQRFHCGYVARGLYAVQLAELARLFRHDQIAVVSFDSLKTSVRDTCARLLSGLVPDAEYAMDTAARNRSHSPRSELLARIVYRGKRLRQAGRMIPPGVRRPLRAYAERFLLKEQAYPPMEPETRRMLRSAFSDSNAELARHAGIDVSGWR